MIALQHLKGIWKKCSLLASLGLSVALSPLAAQDIYWTVNGKQIMGSELDGSDIRTVFDGTGMDGSPVDVVATVDKIYWTDKADSTSLGGIWRADRNGSNPERFISNDGSFQSPQFILISGDRLYFSCYFTGIHSALLSDGSDLKAHGGTGGSYTALVRKSDNELIYVNGGSGTANFYLLNTDTGATSTYGATSGDGQHYGLVRMNDDTLYHTSFGGGFLASYTPSTWASSTLVDGLAQPLGLKLSASGTHLIYTERGTGTISAYEIATGEVNPIVTGGNAFFGVAIFGDPVIVAEDPLPPPAPLPVVETFEGGTPGVSIQDKLTSDEKAHWRVSAQAEGTTLNYGGETGNMTFEPHTQAGEANVYLEHDVDETEEFWITFDDVLLRAGRGDVNGVNNLATRVTIGARKTDKSDLGAYRIGQWHAVIDGDKYQFRYGIHYVDPAGETHISPGNWIAQTVPLSEVDAGDYSGSELLLSGLELRVRGSEQRLYLNGDGLGPWFPTQATYNDGNGDVALVINTTAVDHEVASMNPIFNGLTLDVPPDPGVPPFKRLYVYEPFDYPEGDLVGQNGGLGWAEAWVPSTEGNRTDWPIAQVLAPGQTFGDLLVDGNKGGPVQGGRGFRSIDVPGLYTGGEESAPSNSIGWPGSSVWLSFIAEGFAAQSDPFWGVSLFNDAKEKLFFGKATNGAGLRLSAQGGSQQFGDAISINDKHFIAIRIDFDPVNGDSATLFLNPDPANRTPSDDDALGVYTGAGFDMAFNRVRLANGGGPGGTIDEVRIGATWADVTPVPYSGFVNGDLEDEPFTRGWSYVQHITPHAGIAPGSTTAAYIKNDTSGPTAWPLLSQHRPNTLEFDTIPYLDPVTQEPLAPQLQPTGPNWQVGFHTAVADPGAAGNRSLNVGIGHERPADYTGNSQPAINFRIIGGGGAQAFNTGTGWQDVFPAGTFTPSTVTDGEFLDPTVYYIQFDGDYSTSSPTYTVSARRAGEAEFFAVSEPMSAFQYQVPPPGSGIVTVRFNGAVQAPYVVDDIHMITVGGEPSAGYTAWAAQHFSAAELADESVSGQGADPDGDGIENLIEYALGGDPKAADRSILPETTVVNDNGQDYLQIVFGRNPDATDVNITVLGSSDLVEWSATPTLQSSEPSGGLVWETWRDSQPISQNGRRFLNVAISVNEPGMN